MLRSTTHCFIFPDMLWPGSREAFLPFHSIKVLILSSVIVVFALFPEKSRAQFSGSAALGTQLTNNVQRLDTVAPDQVLLPAFELNYDVHPSQVSTISLSGSYTPSFYNINPALSFQETSIGATGTFYLTHQDAIAAESEETSSTASIKPAHSSHFRNWEPEPSSMNEPTTVPLPSKGIHIISINDSLVTLADSLLYELSAELDSTEISSKGISKSRAAELEDLRDSISEVLSTVADILDSTGYSESVAEVVLEELQDLHTPLESLTRHTQPSHLTPSLLDQAITTLHEVKPEKDYLPVAPTASAPLNIPPNATPEQKKMIQSVASIINPSLKQTNAPALTLVSSTTRMRQFGYNDATIQEDIDDSNATTMALQMTVPIDYSNQAGVHYSSADSIVFGGNYGGNPNDTKILTFGTAFEEVTSTNFSLRGSYNYSHTLFPFDSVYSATENRITLTPKTAIGASSVLFGEAAVGFKKYLDPLIVTVSQTVHRIKKSDTTISVSQAAASSFDQFSFGLGFSQFIGEDFLLGGVVTFNRNPNLRAYVTTAQVTTGPKGKAVRANAQIADDEYTYNLGRYTLFSDARVPGAIDLGADLSYEHRVYGSAVGKKGNALDSGRTENGTFFNISASKLFPFESELAGIFNALILEAKLDVENVTSTQQLYNYDLAEFTFTATLIF